jgi:hypothetical protein
MEVFHKRLYETQVWISLTDRINEVQRRQRLALSTCVRCHSGGMMGPVACENGCKRGPLHRVLLQCLLCMPALTT